MLFVREIYRNSKNGYYFFIIMYCFFIHLKAKNDDFLFITFFYFR